MQLQKWQLQKNNFLKFCLKRRCLSSAFFLFANVEIFTFNPLILHMQFNREGISDETLWNLYYHLAKPRMIEEKMLVLLRQGRISKWFSGIGQEAISVGATLALHHDEYLLPMHRNLGMFTGRNMPFSRLFSQWQGKMNGFSKGRERSFHFGSNEHHIVGMISHLGPQLGVADGIALACKLKKEKKATLVISGDGGTSEGDFHEALNTAAVWDLPVIFCIESNGYGLSTPSNEQFRCKSIADKGIGYGMKALTIDGNNILEVYSTVKKLAEEIRENPHPILLECITFRMRGHEEASGTKYVPKELFEEWRKKDPLLNYEKFLLDGGIMSPEGIKEVKRVIKEEIDAGVEEVFAEPEITVHPEEELEDVYAPYSFVPVPPSENKKEMRLVDAIQDGLRESMRKFDSLVVMGQDVAEYGGVFKVTEGFLEEFGEERVRNTPLCESAIVGVGLGMSIRKMKSVVEMQFADFVTSGFNPIVNNLAKIHYRWGQNADVVIRMPTGAGVGAGPFHSQSNESWFMHTPGLKIAYPAFPEDAKGLLIAAIEDPNPVMYFEHKALYRSINGNVSEGYFNLPFGVANTLKTGNDVTIITYGFGVHWALEYLKDHPEVSADLIDLRTLAPLDTETIYNSVKRTGKAIILHECTLTGGIGAEIAALINEHCFEYLDAPVVRCGSLDTPVPFASELEWNFLPKKRFGEKLQTLLNY
jgi:2-oxoisovalerate dehydrogenase E1 component